MKQSLDKKFSEIFLAFIYILFTLLILNAHFVRVRLLQDKRTKEEHCEQQGQYGALPGGKNRAEV